MEDDCQSEKPSGSLYFRHRSPTFSQEEIKALLNIVEKYKTIIFNKATNTAAIHAKETAWLKISKIYNRQGFKHVRSADCLKIKLDNMKKRARNVSKNLMDGEDELNSQLVAMMFEAENNSSCMEKPGNPEVDLNDTEDLKDSNDVDFIGDDNSDDSSMDADTDTANKRLVHRSMNFSPEECNLLLQCVRQEKNVIFSKANISGLNKMKRRAWERVANSYNKLSPQKRSPKVLRTKFTNMKAKATNFGKYFKQFSKKEDSDKVIKPEPLSDYRSSVDVDDADDDYVDDHTEPDDKSNSDVNTTLDPLSTVLNSELGSISQFESKEVVKLKLELLNYKMETAKLKRKRLEDLMQADAAERESRARESSLRLRAARLDAIAAEMKLPPAHSALAYCADEARAQHYVHQYHAS